MRFGSAISVGQRAADAVREAAGRAAAQLSSAPPDLAVVFLAGFAAAEEQALARELSAATGAAVAVGCTAGGVIAGGREIEGRRAAGVTLVALGAGGVRPFHAPGAALPDDDAGPAEWTRMVGVEPSTVRGFVLLADPTTAAGTRAAAGLDFAYPAAPKVGGLESSGRAPGRGRLFTGDRLVSEGVVGLTFTGDLGFDAVVAQGARPFGASGVVTKADRHFLQSIDGAPALEFFRTQLSALDDDDQRRPLGAVCVGIDADPLRVGEPEDGGYLIRNLLGADESNGVVAVGDELHAGRRIRLHLRDAAAGAYDLRNVLRRGLTLDPPPAGAFLFSCLGRGAAFFGESDHDSRVFAELAGPAPVGGFFCAGEIGPVGPRTHLHGYTSSFAVLRPG